MKNELSFQGGAHDIHAEAHTGDSAFDDSENGGKHPEPYVRQLDRDSTRPRTLTFETVLSLLLTMSENSIGKVVLIGRFQKASQPKRAAVQNRISTAAHKSYV